MQRRSIRIRTSPTRVRVLQAGEGAVGIVSMASLEGRPGPCKTGVGPSPALNSARDCSRGGGGFCLGRPLGEEAPPLPLRFSCRRSFSDSMGLQQGPSRAFALSGLAWPSTAPRFLRFSAPLNMGQGVDISMAKGAEDVVVPCRDFVSGVGARSRFHRGAFNKAPSFALSVHGKLGGHLCYRERSGQPGDQSRARTLTVSHCSRVHS